MVVFWILIFIVSLILLIKSADWLVESSERIGLVFKISPFVIGVTIVAVGTSLPELASSVVAVLKGATEIVVANAIGSNIANILLVIGLSAIVARRLVIRKNMIDLNASLLAVATLIFLFMVWDRKIVFGEGIILILVFLIYLLYVFFRRRTGVTEETLEIIGALPSRKKRREKEVDRIIKKTEKDSQSKLNFKTFLFLVLGIIGLAVGANYIIESVLKISEVLKISTSLIAITVVAIGTSLPEFAVSIRASWKKKYEVALGNIFGSNIFNILLVTGIPALISPLVVDTITFKIGFPFLIVATLLFVISGISRKIHAWEGVIYLLIYILFLVKLFGLF